MKTYLILIIISALLISTTVLSGQPIDVSTYAWQFPVVSNLTNVEDLKTELQEEIQKVLDSGHLAPVMFRYGDQIWDSYWLYQEPGRIITTLAWSYPYLTTAQQTATRAYVANELQHPAWAPWGEYPLSRTEGTRREYHPLDRIWSADSWMGHFRPYLHTIYGLWLYAYRTGEWNLLQTYLSDIESLYNDHADQARTYGSACADIAMIRIEEHFGRAAQRDAALANLQTHLTNGLNFDSVEAFLRNGYQGWDAPYGQQYDSRNENFIYQGWMFLNMSPEIGRYLHDYHLASFSSRNQWAKNRFPLWWLSGSRYFSRWTGDESVGLTSEMFGMIVPVERWVLNTDATQLRSYLHSTPNCIGDCYWIEALITAIEAHGSTTWSDVRAPNPVSDLAVTTSGNDVILHWTTTGATSYHIYASSDSDTFSTLIQTVMIPPVTLVNELLIYNTRYYRVVAVR